MDPISTTASIIAILQLSSKVLGYLNDVRDASRDRAKCAVEAADLNSLLTALRFRLEEGDPSTPWYTAVRDLATEHGPLDQFKQALQELQKKITGRGKIGMAGNALVWKFKKEEIASILGRMERLKTLVEIALQMDHFELSQAMKKCGDATLSNTELIRDDTSFIRHEANHAQHGKLMAWISPTDFPTKQCDVITGRQQGTGQWFLDASEVAQWLRQPKGTLFCPGIPGAGKTMIAAIAVDHLLKTVQSSCIGVAYVYCNYKAQEEQSTNNLLAAILKQLVQARSSLMEPVERMYVQHINQGTRPAVDEIFAALEYVLAKFTTVYVVIDALDECRDSDGTRRLFLAKLQDLQAKTDLRIMATSRMIPDIINEFKTAITRDIHADDDDVKRFVAGQVHRLPKCIQRDADLQKMVQDKITEAVGGMFLLARLYLDSLLDKRTPKEVKSTLTRLSKGSNRLDDAYRGAIQRIEGQLSGDLERAKKVLYWITYAKRPLNTAEICCALAVEPEEVELDPENIPEIEDLVSVCAGLVVVDPESAIIRLVHYTAQEYFERIREQWKPSALLEITSTCLTYLCFDAFKYGSSATDEEFEDRLRQSQFLDYAAKHWGEHAIIVEGEACEQACSFLLHEGLVSCAVQVMSAKAYNREGYSQWYCKKTTGLHLTARFGLSLLSEKILPCQIHEVAIAITDKDGFDRTPLYLAADHGHFEMAKLLLDMGADVNAQGGPRRTALQAACIEGHEQIVKLLINKGADVNARGRENWSYCLVQSVFQQGNNMHNLRILLDNGAEITAQSAFFEYALMAASYIGHEQIVRLLLDNGADVNAQGRYIGSALNVASEEGHERIVKLLLDNGADVNIQGYTGTSLQRASEEGHEQIVQLLLDNGADINTQAKRSGSALQRASREGHDQIVQLLLDNGAELNARRGHLDDALGAAGRNGRVEVVKLLLEAGSDPKSHHDHYGSFLHLLAFHGHMDLLRLIYDKYYGTPLPLESHGPTPLQLAARGGHFNAFQYLLSLGFDAAMTDEKGETLLHYASSGGSLEILNAVLHMKCDSHTQSEHWSPIHWACRNGNPHLVERLIKEGIHSDSVTVPKPEGQWSPISIAIFHGNEKMLNELSEHSISLLDTGEDVVRLHGISEKYWCNGCFHDIYGPRFHCRMCSDLDYCFMCEPFLRHLHKNHEWNCFESPVEDENVTEDENAIEDENVTEDENVIEDDNFTEDENVTEYENDIEDKNDSGDHSLVFLPRQG